MTNTELKVTNQLIVAIGENTERIQPMLEKFTSCAGGLVATLQSITEAAGDAAMALERLAEAQEAVK